MADDSSNSARDKTGCRESAEFLIQMGIAQPPGELLRGVSEVVVAEIRDLVAAPDEWLDEFLPGVHSPDAEPVSADVESIRQTQMDYFWCSWKLHVHFYGPARAIAAARRMCWRAGGIMPQSSLSERHGTALMMLYAAQYALLGYGVGAPELAEFESTIDSFRDDEEISWMAGEYEWFKKDMT